MAKRASREQQAKQVAAQAHVTVDLARRILEAQRAREPRTEAEWLEVVRDGRR
jgi:hypothetical protein